MLRQAMEELGLEFVEAPGEAAFYGPKLDVQVRTALGKDETLSTVQLDFHLPNRFNLEYVGEDGERHRPVVIHRGVVGTMERFTAFLIEQYKGAFPAWLAPTQAVVASVADDFAAYAEEVADRLRQAGLRVEADVRPDKIGYKIRQAQIHKIPYTLVVGQRELQEGTVSVRKYQAGDQGQMAIDAFAARLRAEVDAKELLVDP
ncbi:hypothetical protein GCM10025858_08700 [Alicyclobacillus sacchari]|nr:hypothetical protein GCM10025858_08700 [Alicyclobacillus sacchari]